MFRQMFALVFVAALSGSIAGPARADTDAFRQAGIQYCGDDARRLCRYVFPGGGRIARCLMSQYERLSPRCRTFVADAQSSLYGLAACKHDTDRHCADVPPGGGRVIACLEDHHRVLSRGCAHALRNAEAILPR